MQNIGQNSETEKKKWAVPELIDLDSNVDDVENLGGMNSDGGGRTTS